MAAICRYVAAPCVNRQPLHLGHGGAATPRNEAGVGRKSKYFILIDHKKFDSERFQKLSYTAVWAFLELKRGFLKLDENIYGKTEYYLLPYGKSRLSTKALRDALVELRAAGFIDVHKPGKWEKHKAAEYRETNAYKVRSDADMEKEKQKIETEMRETNKAWEKRHGKKRGFALSHKAPRFTK